LGACLGELVAGKKLGKKAMLFGAVINNIPDIDVVCYLWMDPTEALLAHRGITHSIIFNGLLAFILANGLFRIFKKWHLPLSGWLLLTSTGLFTHILLDTFNTYGTGLLEPFTSERYSLNALFILDPFFTVPLLVAAVALLFIKAKDRKRKLLPRTALVLSSLYLFLCGVNKIYIQRVVNRGIEQQGIAVYDYFISPTPFNNLLWYIVINDGKNYYIGYSSVQDKEPPVFHKVLKNDSLLASLKGSKSVQNLVLFSKGYYSVTQTNGDIIFNNLRFGQESGWLSDSAPFVFSYVVCEDKVCMLEVQKVRFRAFRKESLSELWIRILGQ